MHRPALIVVVISVLLGGAVITPSAAGSSVEEVDDPMVHVDVSADGDATVSLVTVYELSDDDERSAFESLQEDEEAQHELRDRFSERMGSVAESVDGDDASAITDESIDVRTEGEYGIVTLSVEWADFAEADGETLVVTEPFASGFEAEHQLVIAGPDDASIESTSHDPVVEEVNQASWEGGTELDGFEMVISVEDTGSDGTGDSDNGTSSESDDEIPGFGVVAVVIAIVVGLGIAVFSLNTGQSRGG